MIVSKVFCKTWGNMRTVTEHTTKYNQLYDIFHNKIISGEWKNGQKLLPERELCEEFNVSRITLRQTLQMLEEAKLITRKQGRGTFIQNRPVEQKLTKLYSLREHFNKIGIKSTAKITQYEIIRANRDLSEKLEIGINDEVIKIKRVFYAETNPYVLERTFLPLSIFPDMTRKKVAEDGLYNTFNNLGVRIIRATEKLQPLLLKESTAKILNEKVNSVGMRIERTTYSENDLIVEYTESIVPGEFFTYTVELS